MMTVKSPAPVWLMTTLLVSALVALPLISILLGLFAPEDETWTHLKDTVLSVYIGNTLLLMIMVGLFTGLIGTSTAWFISATSFPGQRFFSWALVLPLAAPGYIIAYVYTDFLEFSGPLQTFLREITGWHHGDYWFPQIRSLTGAALMLSLVLYPYVYLLARTSFSHHSASLFGAARSLGAGPVKAFFRIALPAARPAIVGGMTLALMETVADFGVVEFFGIPTFSTGIFRVWFAMGEKETAIKLAAVMLSVVLFLLFLERLNRRHIQASPLTRDNGVKRLTLSPVMKGVAFVICAAPVLLGAILPMGILLHHGITVGDPMLRMGFGIFVQNSIFVAVLAMVLAVVIALFLTYAQRFNPTKIMTYGIGFATLGYALPGTMLAIGLLGPLSAADHMLADFLNEKMGLSTGLILTGTVMTLIYAYVVRFLTVAYNSCATGQEHIPVIYDAAARSLGAGAGRLIKAIHLPLMRRSIIVAGMLVFVDVMRELPATLLLRPFNFETLSTRVYRLAADERIAEASTAALMIVFIGLIPVLVLNRLSEKALPD